MENQKSGVRLIIGPCRKSTTINSAMLSKPNGFWWKSVWASILSVSRGAKTGWVDHTQEFSLNRIIVNTFADLFQ